MQSKNRFSIVIPVYNHEQNLREVVLQALELKLPLFVVDDGSTDNSYGQLRDISGIHVFRHKYNQGKGAALLTGFAAALKQADWAVTIDADGQHNPIEALNLLQAIPQGQRPLVIGMRKNMSVEKAPWTSRFGREFSNFWVMASGCRRLRDSQSGFRVYPLPEAMDLNIKTRRYQFELEVLVRFCQNKTPIIEVPVSVNYSPGGQRISHFKPFLDFMRNTALFTKLISARVFKATFNRH